MKSLLELIKEHGIDFEVIELKHNDELINEYSSENNLYLI